MSEPRGSCEQCYGDDMEGCIDGRWYGPCFWEDCYGLCEYDGMCTCPCHKGDDE